MTAISFGGTDLSTFGNITMLDDLYDLPQRRGNNKVIPYKHGSIFSAKYYEERSISIGIAITELTLAALEAKLNTMRALFSPNSQQTLSIVYEDASTKTVLASVDKPMQVKRILTFARVVIEFTLPEPFLRSDTIYEVTSDVIDGTPTPQTLTVVNNGTIAEMSPVLVLTGALENPVVTNTTNSVSLTYTGVIDAAETVTIGVLNGEYYATHSVDGNVIGNVTHGGSPALMVFEVGNNAVTISDANYAGSGTLKVSYFPPYL